MWTLLAALFGLSLIITLPWIACSRRGKQNHRKLSEQTAAGPPKSGAKQPGHLPEFADPDQREANTFYDVQSCVAFPAKDEKGKTPPPVTSCTLPPGAPAAPGQIPTPNGEPSMLATTPAITAVGSVASKQQQL